MPRWDKKEDALREGQCALELLPLEKDAFGGMGMVNYLSVTAAWAGTRISLAAN